MSLKTYRRLTFLALIGVLLFIFRDVWLPDKLLVRSAAAALFIAGYGLYWSITVRRLRDCGQSTMFGWCFVFGGAIIPIYIGCTFADLNAGDCCEDGFAT